jgi:hypothetical protein
MRIIIPTAGMVVGATVGAITYYSIVESGNVVATATHYGSYAIGKLAGKGLNVIIGPTTASLVETTTIGTGQACLVPIIRASSKRAALATAAAVGAASAVATALVVHSGTWIANRVHTSLSRFLYQPPAEAPVCIKDSIYGFQVIDLIDDISTSRPEQMDHLPSS